MRSIGRDTFLTLWGWMGAVWSDGGVEAVVLPMDDRRGVEERIAALAGPASAAGTCRQLRDQLGEYFEGRRRTFSLPLGARAPGEFTARVWQAVREVPYGCTVTYGEIARQAGRPGSSRAAGRALGRNPVPLLVPCHRVVASAGPGGFTGPGGVGMKLRLLRHERRAGGG